MILVQNKKVNLEYKIEERKTFGVELLGGEVKSLKKKQGNLDGGRILLKGGELFLLGVFIPAYQEKNSENIDHYRIRKLLATKKEIRELHALGHGNNLQIFPINFHLKGKFIKLEIGIGTKHKKQDKREYIKERDLSKKGNE
jgi:SsrA-binding protein